jgi:hypothetical protein
MAIPIDQWTAGTGPLAAGDFVQVFVYRPGTGGAPTPAPVRFLNLRVLELWSDKGLISSLNWNAVKTVIVEISADEAPALQQALSEENVTLVYQKILETPTATLISTPREEKGMPTATVAPGWVDVSIPFAWIQNPIVFPDENDGGFMSRLVIVFKSSENRAGDQSSVSFTSQEFCVTVLSKPVENSPVKIRLKIDDLADYAEAIAAQAGVYLVADPDCMTNNGRIDQTSTPVPGSTATVE